MKITMNYLKQIELFIIKKLLLETGDKPTEYLLQDFNDTGAKVIIDCFLQLAKEDFLTISSIKIGYNFFANITIDFVDVDLNERGKPISGGINYKKIKDCDYLGFGQKTFERYEKECCPDGNIIEPEFDLEINSEELKYIIKNSANFPTSYENLLFENLTFYFSQDKKLLFELKTPFDTVLLANKCSSMLRG